MCRGIFELKKMRNLNKRNPLNSSIDKIIKLFITLSIRSYMGSNTIKPKKQESISIQILSSLIFKTILLLLLTQKKSVTFARV